MINEGKLKNAIKQYELVFRGRWSDEKFKWEAIKNFHELEIEPVLCTDWDELKRDIIDNIESLISGSIGL